jgi:hypothetical protein
MYDTLRPELLTATEAQRKAMERDPVTVVTWDLFRVRAPPSRPASNARPRLSGQRCAHPLNWPVPRAAPQDNQLPYLEVRRPFMLGVLGGSTSAGAPDYRPTLAHFFMRVAHDRQIPAAPTVPPTPHATVTLTLGIPRCH